MKKLIYLLMTIIIVNISLTQCPQYPSDWGKKLTNSSYTWAFSDFNVVGIVSINGHIAQESDIPIIHSAIRSAVNAWKNAVNSEGVVITFTELPIEQYNSADIKIKFGASDCGIANPITKTIELGLDGWMSNPNTPYPWGTNGQADKVDLQTIVVHELGHLFLGGSEWTSAIPNTVMRGDLCQSAGRIFRSPLSCDVQAVLNFYNPFINITVANSFGGGIIGFNEGRPGGGTFPSGTTFERRQSSFPHTISAINQDFPENNIIYHRVFDKWIRPNPLPDIITNPLQISSGGEYTANFLKLFNVAVTNAQFIEPGTGGSYKVDGVDVGSNWLGTIKERNSKTLEAIPPSGYIFVGWSDGETANPRNLSPTDHIENLRAIYKLPLRSSISTATGPNSQRKLVSSEDGTTMHLIYESRGHIWYTKSINSGTNWSPEEIVSSLGDGINSSPSVCIDNFTNSLYVVWHWAKDGSPSKVLMRKKSNTGWSAISTVSSNVTTNSQPVISIITLKLERHPYNYYRRLISAFQSSYGWITISESDTEGASWGDLISYQGYDPTISPPRALNTYNVGIIDLSFERQGKIYTDRYQHYVCIAPPKNEIDEEKIPPRLLCWLDWS